MDQDLAARHLFVCLFLPEIFLAYRSKVMPFFHYYNHYSYDSSNKGLRWVATFSAPNLIGALCLLITYYQ